jgi:hypothetical protein
VANDARDTVGIMKTQIASAPIHCSLGYTHIGLEPGSRRTHSSTEVGR